MAVAIDFFFFSKKKKIHPVYLTMTFGCARVSREVYYSKPILFWPSMQRKKPRGRYRQQRKSPVLAATPANYENARCAIAVLQIRQRIYLYIQTYPRMRPTKERLESLEKEAQQPQLYSKAWPCSIEEIELGERPGLRAQLSLY